jgi:hypothetical protein
MKSILLTTTAIVAFAGAAAADGHVTMSWSGTATAGIAREGGSDAVEPSIDTIIALVESLEPANEEDGIEAAFEILNDLLDPIEDFDENSDDDDIAEAVAAEIEDTLYAVLDAEADLAEASAVGDSSWIKEIKKDLAEYEARLILLRELSGSAEVATGDFDTYAEINATVVGTVAMDNGVTVSAAMSVDAGRGYNFADDDGFDGAKTNGVGFDWVKIDGGAAGTLTIDPDDIAHLVDGDDDAAADVMYTNDFGMASITLVVDVDKDTDNTPSKAAFVLIDNDDLEATDVNVEYISESQIIDSNIIYNAPVAADVQWSAKIAAPVADIATVYAAFDEEGGNVFGGSATVAGMTITASSKLEAREAEEKADRSNTVGASYTMGAITVGGEWNSIEDGNQWSINGAYSDGTISLAASTNEGEEWEITGAYALSDNASLEGGVNYTEDAFVGVSFSF